MIEILEISSETLSPFWNEHIKHLIEDHIITDTNDIRYFTGEEYRTIILEHIKKERNKRYLVYFIESGKTIGASSFCIYPEDGECFILDFWLFREHKGDNKGGECFSYFEEFTKKLGAKYYLLSCEKRQSILFWEALGFKYIGHDKNSSMPLYKKYI